MQRVELVYMTVPRTVDAVDARCVACVVRVRYIVQIDYKMRDERCARARFRHSTGP